jgi:hypothetical protein
MLNFIIHNLRLLNDLIPEKQLVSILYTKSQTLKIPGPLKNTLTRILEKFDEKYLNKLRQNQ